MTTTIKKTKSKLIQLVWDEHEVIENQARYFMEQGEAANEKAAFEMACGDADHIGFEYDHFLENFSAILSKLSKKGRFLIEGQNMGWRHLSGQMDLRSENSKEFIARSFPRTSEWTLKGEFDPYSKCLTYRLFHHDAPTGELYKVIGL